MSITGAGDPQRVRQAQAGEKRREKQAAADFTAVMQTREGRAVMWALLSEAGVFRTCYTAGDPYGTTFREGERNTGLRLLKRMQELTPHEYVLMTSEAQAKDTAAVEAVGAGEPPETEVDDG